jgi:hypothetical protein
VRLARNAGFSSVLAFSLLIALLPAACGGGAATETAAVEPEREERPVSDEGKSWNGWRWRGKRQQCFFRIKNHCYDKLEAACRAARCAESACSHDDSVPAVVSCRR